MKVALTVILAILGITSGGWMLFDGTRRLAVGDYVRIDGQLGPWTHLVRAIGLDPMSTFVALAFVTCGIARLIATLGIVGGARWGYRAMLWTSVAILWYLPVGTAIALLSIIILLLPVSRRVL